MFELPNSQTQRHTRPRACPQCDKAYCNGDSCVNVPAYVDAEASFSGRIARQHTHGGKDEMYQCKEPETRLCLVPVNRDPPQSRHEKRIVGRLEKLRQEFLTTNRNKLETMVPGLQALHATELNHGVVKDFFNSLKCPNAQMKFEFYGTSVCYIDPISSKGLLLGHTRAFPIRRYSWAGRKRINRSRSYCDTNSTFLCAVADYPVSCVGSVGGKKCNQAKNEWREVRHNEEVMIIFNGARVLPLFLLEWKDPDPATLNTSAEPLVKKKAVHNSKSKATAKEVIMYKRKKQDKQRSKDRDQLRICKWED